MAIGEIKQIQGPFNSGHSINLGGHCIIGISVNEDDFMSWDYSIQNEKYIKNSDPFFTINGELIWLGRTYIYLTEESINNAIITFPKGAPDSTLINIVYCKLNE